MIIKVARCAVLGFVAWGLAGCSGGSSGGLNGFTNDFIISANKSNALAIGTVFATKDNRGNYLYRDPDSTEPAVLLSDFNTDDLTQVLSFLFFSKGGNFSVGDTVDLQPNISFETLGKGHVTYSESLSLPLKFWTSQSGTARITSIQKSTQKTEHPYYGTLYGQFTIEYKNVVMQPSPPSVVSVPTNGANGSFIINGRDTLNVYEDMLIIN